MFRVGSKLTSNLNYVPIIMHGLTKLDQKRGKNNKKT